MNPCALCFPECGSPQWNSGARSCAEVRRVSDQQRGRFVALSALHLAKERPSPLARRSRGARNQPLAFSQSCYRTIAKHRTCGSITAISALNAQARRPCALAQRRVRRSSSRGRLCRPRRHAEGTPIKPFAEVNAAGQCRRSHLSRILFVQGFQIRQAGRRGVLRISAA